MIFGKEDVEASVEKVFQQCEYAQRNEMLAYAFKTTTSDSGTLTIKSHRSQIVLV
jgi:hypothetical protein